MTERDLGIVDLSPRCRLVARWQRDRGRGALQLAIQWHHGTAWLDAIERHITIPAHKLGELERLVLAALDLASRELRG